jgi:hypothetical protein
MRHGPARTADPALTFAVGIVLTPALCYPTVAAAGRGAIDLSAAAGRIVVVLVTAWCAVHAVATLFTWLIRPARSSPPSPPGAASRPPSRTGAERAHADAA